VELLRETRHTRVPSTNPNERVYRGISLDFCVSGPRALGIRLRLRRSFVALHTYNDELYYRVFACCSHDDRIHRCRQMTALE
jgi:hypothetical protein